MSSNERLKRINKVCNILEGAGFKKLAANYRNLGTPQTEDMGNFMPSWTPPTPPAARSRQTAKPFSDLESRDDRKNYDSIIMGHEKVLQEIEENTPADRVPVEKIKYLIQLQVSTSIGDLNKKIIQWRDGKLKELENQTRINRVKDSRGSKRR